MTLTTDERIAMRRTIGAAVLRAQKDFHDKGPDVVVPEIIDALLSLAANISRVSAELPSGAFLHACKIATRNEWPVGEEE